MTCRELYSLQEDLNRIKSLTMELKNLEDFNPYKQSIITDMPKGSGGKSINDWYAEEKERIEKELEFYKKKLQIDREKIDKYISEAPYPECDIIRFRVINNLSWGKIGDLIGYDRRSVSRKFKDYVKDAHNAQNAPCVTVNNVI